MASTSKLTLKETADQIAEMLPQAVLRREYFTVGTDEMDTIFVYVHQNKREMHRVAGCWPIEEAADGTLTANGFKVQVTWVGKVKPL